MNKSPARAETEADLHLLTRLLATAHQLEARLEAELADVGLSLAKFGVLKTLAESNQPMPLSQLAERNRCVRSNITQLVDRLEAEGLVQRVDDASDRRVVRASLTPQGRQSFEEGTGIITAHEHEVSDALSEDDSTALRGMLGRLAQ